MPPPSDITRLLVAWSDGDQSALERLLPFIEKELHRIARNYMRRENPGHTLQPTALVNEAFLKLIDQRDVRWQNRAHFYAIAAKIMRRILINHARDRHRLKRGGDAVQVSLSELTAITAEKSAHLIALDEALTKMEAIYPRAARGVELRFFGGLSVKETAEVQGVSEATINRDWEIAKAVLAKEIGRDG